MKVLVLRSLIIFIIFNLFTVLAPMVSAKAKKTSDISKLFSYQRKLSAYSVEKWRHTCRKSKKMSMRLKKALRKINRPRTEIASECLAFGEEMKKAIANLEGQPAILHLEGNTAVVGDIHGDYENLIKIIDDIKPLLESGETSNVLFLGDYIDRGPSSTKALIILLRFFNENPGKVFLLRGNHEISDTYTDSHGKNLARNEVVFKTVGEELIFKFFNQLPYAAIINEETLAVHGGVPRRDFWERFWCDEKVLDDEEEFKPIFSAIWSDYNPNRLMGNALLTNALRGGNNLVVSYNEDCVKEFFAASNRGILKRRFPDKNIRLKYLIRGHQPWLGDFHQSPNKIVTTVFSAVKGQDFVEPGRKARVAIVKKGIAPELFIRSR